jgi:hypothetical protein
MVTPTRLESARTGGRSVGCPKGLLPTYQEIAELYDAVNNERPKL